MSVPVHESFSDDAASDGESDASSEAPPHDSHYQLISSGVDPDDNSDEHAGSDADIHLPAAHSNGGHLPHLSYPNPTVFHAEIPLSLLDLNGGADRETLASEEEEEEEREREESIARAFREDESRRTAPLGQENAARIVDAMRGVAFPGIPPDWSNQVPEEHWLDHLRRIRS